MNIAIFGSIFGSDIGGFTMSFPIFQFLVPFLSMKPNVLLWGISELDPMIIKVPEMEQLDCVDNPRYQVFCLTPSERGDIGSL